MTDWEPGSFQELLAQLAQSQIQQIQMSLINGAWMNSREKGKRLLKRLRIKVRKTKTVKGLKKAQLWRCEQKLPT